MSTIATGNSAFGENRLIKAPEETDNTYRLDVGGVTILYDSVELSSSRQTFTFSVEGRNIAALEADTLCDRVQGALAVLARNNDI